MATPPTDPAAFRSSATFAYRLFCFALPLLAVGGGWLGWLHGRWMWLAIGVVIAAAFAFVLWCVVTFMYAMTQDGA